MNKTTKFYHAVISLLFTAIFIFVGVIQNGADPQIPLLFGCIVSGLVAALNSWKWEDLLNGILSGITQSLEAIVILMLIGILIGTWIISGTVPTMIYFGLHLLSPRFFMATAALICAFISCAIGAWGTVGTVGLAFMGIGVALGISEPMVAGCIISGAYLGEIISPFSDATNLTAAVTKQDVFSIVKGTMPIALVGFALVELFYLVLGLFSSDGGAGNALSSVSSLLAKLEEDFTISPFTLLPVIFMVTCIIFKIPAILSMLIGIITGMVIAVILQSAKIPDVLEACMYGYVSNTNNLLIDELLTAGGLMSMMNTCSIVIFAMSFGGIMQKTRQMDVLVAPLLQIIRGKRGLIGLSVISCVVVNTFLMDQYMGISLTGQIYGEEYRKRNIEPLQLSSTLLCGGAVTSPIIPWNTCGIYCAGILGISTVQYLPYAVLSLILPGLYVLISARNNLKQK